MTKSSTISTGQIGALVSVWAVLILQAATHTVHAQTERATGWSVSDDPDSAIARTLETLDGNFIGLEDVKALAIRHSTAVHAAESGVQIAEGLHQSSKAPFDPVITSGIAHSNSEQQVSSPFTGSESRETSIQTGLSWQVPTGTQLGATLQTSKVRTNGPFSTLEPQYSATATFSIVQPLLKGFGRSASAELTASGKDLEGARAGLDHALLSAIATAENLYWDLYAAERNWAVQVLNRNEAETLLRETELRESTGLVDPGQVANARVFLAQEELQVLDSRETVERASDALSEVIGVYPQSSSRRYRTADSPIPAGRASNLDSLLNLAARNNRVLYQAERSLAAAKARESGALWDRLPSLNLIGSIGGNGLAGSPRTVIFANDTLSTSVAGGWSDAYSSALGRDHPTWLVGIELQLPILRHGDRGAYDKARGEVASAENLLVAARRAVERAVRENYREVEQSGARLAAARDGVEAAQEQVRIGYIEYRAGRTTAFELVRLVADHASAQQQYSAALARVAKASANLDWLTASSLPEESDK